MNRARYLLGNINLINIMLTGVLIFLVNMILPLLYPNMQYYFPETGKHKEIVSVSDNKPDKEKTPSPLDYVVIAEQNLFHPERKIPVEVKEAQPLPKPDFVLYGTMISNDINIAYMEDKKSSYSTPGRGNRQRALKPGQSISGYSLSQVYDDKVVMVRGDDRIEVMVTEGRSKNRTKQKPATPPAQRKNLDGGGLDR